MVQSSYQSSQCHVRLLSHERVFSLLAHFFSVCYNKSLANLQTTSHQCHATLFHLKKKRDVFNLTLHNNKSLHIIILHIFMAYGHFSYMNILACSWQAWKERVEEKWDLVESSKKKISYPNGTSIPAAAAYWQSFIVTPYISRYVGIYL